MSTSPSRRAFLAGGLGTGAVAALSACSGQTTTFSGRFVGGSGGGGTKKTVSSAVVDGWDECVAVNYLWKVLLAQKGYTLTTQELDIASTFTGVANKQVDLYFDAWLPQTHAAYWDRFKNKLEVLSTWATGENMLAVPNYVKVDSLADLKSNASEFGGKIIGIEAGAGLMKATRTQIMPGYGLSDFELVEGSSAAMLAALQKAIKAKQPIVVTLWRPHWAFSKFPIKALTDPQKKFGKPDNLQAIAAKGFSDDQPDLAKWLKNFKLSSAQLSSLLLAIRDAGKGHEEAATKTWVDKNKALTDGWLKG